ncbi:hypothetical protein [Massilia sp. DWR3-1-1]|uniref:hypothetical protein n=1 Tax=Massilia sp. DWR3-1-1 TaxID=2804559 RepID=UPI003CF2F216
MMKFNCVAAALLTVSLTGCLEVDQHPAYADGQYAGKRDNRVADTTFRGDNAAWKKAIVERARTQNEYNRANP